MDFSFSEETAYLLFTGYNQPGFPPRHPNEPVLLHRLPLEIRYQICREAFFPDKDIRCVEIGHADWIAGSFQLEHHNLRSSFAAHNEATRIELSL